LKGSLSNSIRDFLPFGKTSPLQNISEQTTPQISTQTNEATTSQAVVPTLRQISTAPVAGAGIFNSTSSVIQDMVKKTIIDQTIRFVDRSTGHIFDTNKDSLSVTKISNTTLPKIYESYLSSNPNVAIFRSLDDSSDTIITETAYLSKVASSTVATSTSTSTISTSTTPTTFPTYTGTPYITKISNLPSGLNEIALAPSSQRLLYLFNIDDKGIFILSNIDGAKPVKLYSSPLERWLLDWPNEKQAVITTKPSGIANGISFLINTVTGALTKIASGNGLTTLVSPDLSTSLVGTTVDGTTLKLDAINLSNKNSINLSLRTLPEKCVWSHTEKSVVYCAVPRTVPLGTYPDSWYQGLVSFTDDLWKINTSTGVSTLSILFTKGYGKNFDAINLKLSSDDSYLIFTNKKDLILWGYNLKHQLGSIILPSVGTSTPKTSTSTTSF